MSNAPQRRSFYELSSQISDAFAKYASDASAPPEERKVALKHLLDVLASVNADILSPDELDVVKSYADQAPDVEVSFGEFMGLLGSITKSAEPVDPEPAYSQADDSLELPPSPSPLARTRSRTASSSSARSTSSSHPHTLSDSEDEVHLAFPSPTDAPAPASSPQRPACDTARSARKKTTSDPADPFAARQRSTPLEGHGRVRAPPSSFKRPVPASRARRESGSGSQGTGGGYSDGEWGGASDPETPSYSNRQRRHTRQRHSSQGIPYASSSASNSGSRPPSRNAFSPTASSPPTSPRLDEGSFHPGFSALSSPPVDDSFSLEAFGVDGHGRDASLADSITSSHDKLVRLQRRNAELEKKLRETERLHATNTDSNDRYILELEDQLKDTDMKLAAKAREEKELRVKERQNLVMISKLETDIASLQRSLESQRTQYANLQSQYHEQLDEAENLREAIREKDKEIRAARSQADSYASELHKWENERASLDDMLSRTKEQLDAALQAEGLLQAQKTENLLLKETIDRLQHELKSNVGASHDGSSAGGASAPGTLSRNLGSEIAQQLETVQRTTEEDSEGEIETVVTTRRRKVRPSVRAVDVGSQSPARSPPVVFEDEMREVADAGTQYDASIFATDSATQTDEPPAPPPELRTQPSRLAASAEIEVQTDVSDVQGELVPSKILEELMRARDSRVAAPLEGLIPFGPLRDRGRRWANRFPGRFARPGAPGGRGAPDPEGIIAGIINSTPQFVMYSALVFLCGVISGTAFLPATNTYHQIVLRGLGYEDRALFAAYNNLDVVGAAGEGSRWMYFIERLVWGSLDQALRHPT